MEAMTTHGAALEASFSAGTAHFVPPVPPSEMNFAAWLAERTPPGADVIALLAPGSRSPLHLPRIRPATATPPSRRSRKRRGSAPAVHAAYLADVEGISPRQLVESGLFDFPSERSARHHIRDGRLTAADLGAWPWAVVEGKPLPRNWWADREFALALQEWSAGELNPLAVSPAVQRLRPRRYTAAVRLPVA
jgi:hypothetical protein